MESTRLWIQDNFDMERLQSVVKKVEVVDPELLKSLKLAFYIISAVLAVTYFVRSLVNQRTSKRSWLTLRARSDPENRANVAESGDKKTTANGRPYGCERNIACKPTKVSD